jgi:hypothetical protein
MVPYGFIFVQKRKITKQRKIETMNLFGIGQTKQHRPNQTDVSGN